MNCSFVSNDCLFANLAKAGLRGRRHLEHDNFLAEPQR